MKTKEEILKMSKEELIIYKSSNDLNLNKPNSNCSYCSNCLDCSNCLNCWNCMYCLYCSNCSGCSDCLDCSNCSYCSYLVNGLYCRNLHIKIKDYKKYYICNIEVNKEEYENKLKEIKK